MNTPARNVAAAVNEGGWLKFLMGARERLPAAERRVADLVLERPHELLQLSLAAVASQAQVSEPTVIRCCRSLGCQGFADFKLRLAQSLASGQLFMHSDVAPNDSVAEMAAKVFGKAA